MKRIFAVLGAAVLIFGLSACSGGETDVDTNGNGNLHAYTVPLHDGRTVTCVVYAGYKAGGITCDWEGLATPDE